MLWELKRYGSSALGDPEGLLEGKGISDARDGTSKWRLHAGDVSSMSGHSRDTDGSETRQKALEDNRPDLQTAALGRH